MIGPAEGSVQYELRQSFRALRREPGFAVAAIALLAVGIGTTVALFTIVKRVLLDPLPYPRSPALVRIVHNIGGIRQTYFNDALINTYAEQARAFESFGVWLPTSSVTITGDGEPEEVRAFAANRGLLTTLGVPPQRGRWFSAEEDSPGAPSTVLLGGGYWQRKYGADPAIVGRHIVINGRPHHVVGIMPADFRFREADVLLPLRLDPARPIPGFRLNGIARMKPGVALTAANADVARMLEIYFDTNRVNTTRAVRWTPTLMSLEQDVVGDVGTTLWVLLGAAIFLLLMVCANVANLFLVRTESRRRELAVRVAMGASGSNLARLLLIESAIVTLIGGALGLLLADAAVTLLVAVEPANLPRLLEIRIDAVVVMAALGVTVLCGLILSVAPIVRAFSPRFTAIGLTGARGASTTREQQRSQNIFVALQIAFAMLLLVSAGLMVRSVIALGNLNPGFARPETLQTFEVTLPGSVVPDLDRLLVTQREIHDKIAAIAGVESVAFTTKRPMDSAIRWSAALSAEDKPDVAGVTPPNRHVKLISPESFTTFGTPIVAGRDFTWTDLVERREVAMVAESLAHEMWGSPAAAVGKRIRQFYGAKGPWREVIGVAGDVYDDGLERPAPATVYWPARLDPVLFAGYQPRRVNYVIRTNRAGTASLLEEVRQAVRSVVPQVPLARVSTLDELYDQSMSRTTFTLTTLALAGMMSLLTGIYGVYGVIAYAVSQRRREIGIRLALGAGAREIRRLFFTRAMAVAAIGILLGSGAAAGFTRLMQSMLFGVEPLDPLTFIAMPIVLALAVALATYIPSRRALAIDPAETMRAE
jgi:putative ABC transport system permease protein